MVSQQGIESLSLREVARRLGVSHQAPYKHFANREELMADAIAKSFDRFSEHLERAAKGKVGMDRLRAIGLAYLDYAVTNPLLYRLMFESPLPERSSTGPLSERAAGAFRLLIATLAEIRPELEEDRRRALALFAWSTVHGLASICAGDAIAGLGWTHPDDRAAAIGMAMDRICAAIRPGMD